MQYPKMLYRGGWDDNKIAVDAEQEQALAGDGYYADPYHEQDNTPPNDDNTPPDNPLDTNGDGEISLDEARAKLDELGITYPKNAGVRRLLELLEAHEGQA